MTLGRPHWWQWPTILSLDAAIVTVLWQRLLGGAGHLRIGWPESFVLGASIWLAYTADRWIEAWRLPASLIRTQRHYFAQRWRWPIAACWLAVFVADLGVALTRLRSAQLGVGLVVLAAALVYLLSHQLIHREHPWRVPKEICIALLLTGGVALFTTTSETFGAVAPWLAVFAVLSFANCALISTWEEAVDETHDAMSLTRQFRFGGMFSRGFPWSIAVISVVIAAVGGPLAAPAMCGAVGGVLLGGVDLLQRHAGREIARVLADAALIVPALAMFVAGSL